MPRYIIVGNGVAGVTAAQSIARAEPKVQVHIFSAEPYLYYRRPMLWKYIVGDVGESALYFRPAEWYERKGIHVHLNAVAIELDPENHLLTLADGGTFDYERLLLATGGRPFVPPFEGADREGVFTLRTLDDAQAIKAQAAQSHNAIVIGGGLLGLETARSILRSDTTVSVLEFMPHLLPRQLCVDGAAVLQSLLEKMGFNILTSAATEEIVGNGHVTGVRLKDRCVIDGEMVIVSAGIRSRIELAQSAHLETNRGIIVGRHMRTSAPDVYAAGDAAEFNGIVYGIIPAAIEQAQIAAANMVEHGSAVYKGTIPSTTLKVAGIDLTCLGNSNATAGDGLAVLTQMDDAVGVFKKLVLKDGKITGAILMGDIGDARAVQQLIQKELDVSAYQDKLLDPGFGLATLARNAKRKM